MSLSKTLAAQDKKRKRRIIRHRESIIKSARAYIDKYGYAGGDSAILLEQLLIILEGENKCARNLKSSINDRG